MKEISTKELSEIICKAIEDEPYFTKGVLIPKIKALITGFRIKLSSENFNAIEKPTDKQRLVRANELMNREVNFWKEQMKKTVGTENMQQFYDEHNRRRAEWGEKIN